jgi:hypothetical protein
MAIHKLGSAGRAYRSAVDPRSLDSYVEKPVKTGIPALQGSIAYFLGRQLHIFDSVIKGGLK